MRALESHLESAGPSGRVADGPDGGGVRSADALAVFMPPERRWACRQVSFARGEIVIDVLLDDRTDRGVVHLAGRILRRRTACPNTPIELRQGKKLSVTLTNPAGNFQFKTRAFAGESRLVIAFADSQLIEILLSEAE